MAEICGVCGLPKEICVCEDIAREQQRIMVRTDKRRYGKEVTVVEGIDAGDIDIHDLCHRLKKECACGGTVKEGRIELQGEHKRRVEAVLKGMGFPVEIR